MISRELDTRAVESDAPGSVWFGCPHDDFVSHEPSNRVVVRSSRRPLRIVRSRVFVSHATEDDAYVGSLRRQGQKTAAEHAITEVERQLKLTGLRKTYESRIDFLHIAAEEDGLEINECSIDDLWRFFDEFKPLGQASIVLTVEGDVRAVWRTGPENHIGIHFKGDDAVHYVVFKRMAGAEIVTRTSGACTISEVAELISRYKMGRLVLG